MLTRYAEHRGFGWDRSRRARTRRRRQGVGLRSEGRRRVLRLQVGGGTHRVQRVPTTESQGRIHTSTATVAVMPEAEEVEVRIDPQDLKIDVYRSTGPGGQSVNTTDSAVRITHCRRASSSRCRTSARSSRTATRRCAFCARGCTSTSARKQLAEVAPAAAPRSARGERAEKIRTYNFPENRLTDHRIKLTVHRLDSILEGAARRVHRRAHRRGPTACARSRTLGDRRRGRRGVDRLPQGEGRSEPARRRRVPDREGSRGRRGSTSISSTTGS